MKDLTNSFGHIFLPVKALLIYRREGQSNDYYIESFDMDKQGCPINAHPLSVKEANTLAKFLQVSEKKALGFLNPKGLLPSNVLYLKSATDGYAVWHTPPQNVKLLFTESLGIPSGNANLPALIWRAGRNSLQLFAVAGDGYFEDTPLCHAPFFNVYEDGRVCMGNVQIRIPKDCGLEQFMALWQDYFFQSYFSHLFEKHQPVKGNIVQLWQSLIATQETFPTEVLINNRYQLSHLIR
jgi:PRTRC genetic system protein B